MTSQRMNGRSGLLVVVGIAALVWGALGIVVNHDQGVGRFFFGPDRIVSGVTAGGPGEAAGIQEGDRIVTVDGIPAEELPMQSRWPQKRAGESRHLTLERDGETVSVEVVYGPPSRDRVADGIRGLLVSVAFLGFGLWALFTVRTSLAWTVALIGVTLAVGSAEGPHLGSWQGVAEHVRIAGAALCMIFILRFLVTFPRPKKVSQSRTATGLIKGAFLLFVALLVVELIVHPILYNVYPIVFMILFFALMILSVAALVHSIFQSTAAERREVGLNLLLAGVVVGVLIPIFLPLMARSLPLPLPTTFIQDWTWVLQILFPASLALAVRKGAELAEAAAT